MRRRLVVFSALLAAACSDAPPEFAEPWDRPIAEYLAEGGFGVLGGADVPAVDEFVIDELEIGSLWSLDLDCVVGSLG